MFEQENYFGIPVDIYALGVVLFAMRAGNYPFEASEMRDGCTTLLESMPNAHRF